MRIKPERFENGGGVLGQYPAVSPSSTAEVIQEAGVVPRRRRAAIGATF